MAWVSGSSFFVAPTGIINFQKFCHVKTDVVQSVQGVDQKLEVSFCWIQRIIVYSSFALAAMTTATAQLTRWLEKQLAFYKRDAAVAVYSVFWIALHHPA